MDWRKSINSDKFKILFKWSFWFAFFHEVGHLMLHAKKSKNFIDTEDTEDKEMELEADNYSRNMILNDNIYKEFVEKIITQRNEL